MDDESTLRNVYFDIVSSKFDQRTEILNQVGKSIDEENKNELFASGILKELETSFFKKVLQVLKDRDLEKFIEKLKIKVEE